MTGALASHQKRYVVSGASRHVIPRRSLAPRLILTWSATLIVAMSPFIWFHLLSVDAAAADAQSKFRKLVVCVFILSFAIPALSVVIVHLLLWRTWRTMANTDRYCKASLKVTTV